MRTPMLSCSTWSFQEVSLYGCSSTWECPSTSPGISVAPGRSIVATPVAPIDAAGPAASIRSPRTRTAQPSCIDSPSNTRAGRNTVVDSGACGADRPWAETTSGSTAIDNTASRRIPSTFFYLLPSTFYLLFDHALNDVARRRTRGIAERAQQDDLRRLAGRN